MTEFVNAKHEITGIVESVPEHYLDHPVLGQFLTLVDEEPDCGCTDDVASEQDTEEMPPIEGAVLTENDEAAFMAPDDEEE